MTLHVVEPVAGVEDREADAMQTAAESLRAIAQTLPVESDKRALMLRSSVRWAAAAGAQHLELAGVGA